MTEGGASLTAAGGGRGVGLRGFDDAGGEELGQQVVHVHLTEVVLRRDDLRIYGDTNNQSRFLTLNSRALKLTDTNATQTYSAVRKARRSEVGRAGPWLPSRSPKNSTGTNTQIIPQELALLNNVASAPIRATSSQDQLHNLSAMSAPLTFTCLLSSVCCHLLAVVGLI